MCRRRQAAWWLVVLLSGCQDAGLEALEQRLVAWRVTAEADVAVPDARDGVVESQPLPGRYRFMGADAAWAPGIAPGMAPQPQSSASEVAGEQEVGREEASRLAPLEEHALETLRLAGTLQVANEYWALVETRAGRVYQVSVGDRLGLRQARIVAIAGAAMYLAERRSDGQGGWSEHDITLFLDD